MAQLNMDYSPSSKMMEKLMKLESKFQDYCHEIHALKNEQKGFSKALNNEVQLYEELWRQNPTDRNEKMMKDAQATMEHILKLEVLIESFTTSVDKISDDFIMIPNDKKNWKNMTYHELKEKRKSYKLIIQRLKIYIKIMNWLIHRLQQLADNGIHFEITECEHAYDDIFAVLDM